MNVEKIDKLLYVEQSFDLLKRELTVGNRKAVMYYINGFCDSDMIQKIEEFFVSLEPMKYRIRLKDLSEIKFLMYK